MLGCDVFGERDLTAGTGGEVSAGSGPHEKDPDTAVSSGPMR